MQIGVDSHHRRTVITNSPAQPSHTPCHADYPAVDVEPAALVHETPYVRRRLIRYGVRRCDLSDVAQEVLIVAWREIQERRYRPSPALALHAALRRWMFGIAWRQASLYQRAAHRRCECFASPPREVFIVESTTESRVDARTLLAVFERVPRKHREVLELIAFGAEPCEAAAELGISREAALKRITYGRERFRRAITRWRRR